MILCKARKLQSSGFQAFAGSWDARGESPYNVPCRCTLCLWGSAGPDRCSCLALVPKGYRAPAGLQGPQQVTSLRREVGWGVVQARAHLSLVLRLDTRHQCCHQTPTASSCREHPQKQPEVCLASREKGGKAVWYPVFPARTLGTEKHHTGFSEAH